MMPLACSGANTRPSLILHTLGCQMLDVANCQLLDFNLGDKGSSINEVMQIWIFSDCPLSHFIACFTWAFIQSVTKV